jgi:hypothetical protein
LPKLSGDGTLSLVNHIQDRGSLGDQLAAVEIKVHNLKETVATIMDQIQTFLAAFNTALTDIANDLTTISANLAANPAGGISATDAAALTAATTAIQTLATQADTVASASGGSAAVANAAKSATPAVAAANS